MANRDFVVDHLIESVRAAAAEAAGDEDLADRLRAGGRLRLMTMSDEELWELARLTASPPERPVESVYEEIKQAIREHQATAGEWLDNLG